jgi:hypothetical protein
MNPVARSHICTMGVKKIWLQRVFWVKDKAAQIEFERVQFEKSSAPNRRQSSPFHLLALLVASIHMMKTGALHCETRPI